MPLRRRRAGRRSLLRQVCVCVCIIMRRRRAGRQRCRYTHVCLDIVRYYTYTIPSVVLLYTTVRASYCYSTLLYIFPLYIFPHTTIYNSLPASTIYYCTCLILLHVSSYHYICVLMLHRSSAAAAACGGAPACCPRAARKSSARCLFLHKTRRMKQSEKPFFDKTQRMKK